MFLYLIGLSLLVPYWRLRKSLRNLKGDISVSSRKREVGQSFQIKYRIINSDSGSFPYLELANTIEGFQQETPYIHLGPGEVKELTKDIYCRRRGIYDLKSLIVRTGDPFGFCQLEKPLAEGGEVKVYPRIRYFPEVALPTYQQVGERSVRNAVFENYNQLASLRDWQDGDSIKRIHWKQSARQDKVIVKNFERTADANISIFIDMHKNSYQHDHDHQLEDLVVELAASLVYSRLRENLTILLFSDAIPKSPIQGRRLRDYEKVMDQIIGLFPSQEGSFFAYLRKQSFYLQPDTSLYVITPSLILTDADVLFYLKRKGFSLVLFYLCCSEVEKDLQKTLTRIREAGIKVHVLHTSEGETKNENKL